MTRSAGPLVVIEACAFRTERLDIAEWHRAADAAGLAETVATMLTAPVTGSLPPDWQGPYDADRAERWIAGRDAEGTTLLASEFASGAPVGLVLLHEEAAADTADVEVRLGYLLAEHAWGRGLGGELVAGFVRWCRSQPRISEVVGGVAPANVASIRILEHCGFVRVERDADPDDDMEYRLTLAL